jgi:hypothetical protein
MLGLVMSLLAAQAAVPPAGPACGDDSGSCELQPVAVEAPREYATPAVIDCRSTVVPPVLSTLVGECAGTPYDASYRASRYPESEDSQSLAPATRDKKTGVASCDGLPQRAPSLPLSDAQPLAVYAAAGAIPPVPTRREIGVEREPVSRFNDPPDRPPRV